MNFLLLCLWCACIAVAFYGWGRLLLRLCRMEQANWPLASLLGASLLTAIGGALNLARLVRPHVLVALVAVGCAAGLFLFFRDEPSSRAWTRKDWLLFAALAAILAAPVLGNIKADPRSFNYYDDLPAYLTLPAETLQLGTLPDDPFNERRVTSSLGAPYFLQSFVLVAGDPLSLRMIDVSIGTMLYAALLVTVARRLTLQPFPALAVAFLTLAVPVFRLNATFVVLPAAAFCGLFLAQLSEREGPRWHASLQMALLASAVCSWKSNYLPAAILGCVFYYLLRFAFERRAIVLLHAALWGVLTFLLLLPWMLDLHAKEGTYLFPMLGRGYDASSYGVIPLPNGSHGSLGVAGLWVWLTVLPMAVPLLLAAAGVCFAWRRRLEEPRFAIPLLAALLAGALSIAAISSSTAGESMGRYSLPFQAPALLIFFVYLLRWRSLLAQPPLWWRGLMGLAIANFLFLGALFGIRHAQYRQLLEDARVLTPVPGAWFNPQRERERDRALQRTIPAGETMLERLFVAYPLDFRRNRIYAADYTGMAGLPPGMPVHGGPQAVGSYLLANGIHYLAYDHVRTLLPDFDPDTGLDTVLKFPTEYGRHGWLYMQVKVSNHEQHIFAQLAEMCPHVYDDGTVYVLDLRWLGRPVP